MSSSSDDESRHRKVAEVFDDLHRRGRSYEEIFATAHDGLKQLARKMVRNENAGTSMQASSLLSELYLKLFGKGPAEFKWESGDEFFASMAVAMRHLLIDYARERGALKRGCGNIGSLQELSERGQDVTNVSEPTKNRNWFEAKVIQAIEIDEALRRLEGAYPRRGRMLNLRYVAGLSIEAIAATEHVSTATVKTELRRAIARMRYYQSELSAAEFDRMDTNREQK